MCHFVHLARLLSRVLRSLCDDCLHNGGHSFETLVVVEELSADACHELFKVSSSGPIAQGSAN